MANPLDIFSLLQRFVRSFFFNVLYKVAGGEKNYPLTPLIHIHYSGNCETKYDVVHHFCEMCAWCKMKITLHGCTYRCFLHCICKKTQKSPYFNRPTLQIRGQNFSPSSHPTAITVTLANRI